MSVRELFEKKVPAQLEELKTEVEKLVEKAQHAETNLELEYIMRIDELRVELASIEQKFELLKQVNEENWDEFKTELEQCWKSLRELIKAINTP